MAIDTWLKGIATGLPLLGALLIWRWGGRFPGAQRWVAAAIFGVAGVSALTLFLLNRHYACILVTSRNNCLMDGVASLSLFLLDVFFAVRCAVPPPEGSRRDLIMMLLLSGALAGMGLPINLLVLIVALNLFLFTGSRWLRKHGFQPRIFVLRDDYKDEDDRR
jgi:hypothetical protein